MTRSRFDNLEHQRPANEREVKSDLSRFAEGDAPRKAFEGGDVDAPGHIPQTANPIERFAASGDDGVALQLKDDSEQPFRRCPSCRRDSTKYETVCKFCQTALDSPEAVAFNEELWKRLQAESQIEQAQREAAHAKASQITQEQHDRLLEAQKNLMKDLDAHYSGRGGTTGMSWQWRLALGFGGLTLLSAAFRFGGLPPIVRIILGGLGLITGALAVPPAFWRATNRDSRGRY
ncbi:MAG: hypothetical protein QM723_02155 [Myxococcaceae bacterium]